MVCCAFTYKGCGDDRECVYVFDEASVSILDSWICKVQPFQDYASIRRHSHRLIVINAGSVDTALREEQPSHNRHPTPSVPFSRMLQSSVSGKAWKFSNPEFGKPL